MCQNCSVCAPHVWPPPKDAIVICDLCFSLPSQDFYVHLSDFIHASDPGFRPIPMEAINSMIILHKDRLGKTQLLHRKFLTFQDKGLARILVLVKLRMSNVQ